MNTTANTERPKLKLNLAAKPLALNTNGGTLAADSPLKRVIVIEKPKVYVKDAGNTPDASDKTKASTTVTKTNSEAAKKSKRQELAVNQKVVATKLTPEEILKEKIKRRKKEYFSILTKLKADFPAVFSEEVKPLAIGIDLELKKILNGQFPNNQLNRFFHRYCGSFKYKEKLVEGAQRFHLDGSPASLVTAKEVPVIDNKPKNISNAAKTVSNEIEPKQ